MVIDLLQPIQLWCRTVFMEHRWPAVSMVRLTWAAAITSQITRHSFLKWQNLSSKISPARASWHRASIRQFWQVPTRIARWIHRWQLRFTSRVRPPWIMETCTTINPQYQLCNHLALSLQTLKWCQFLNLSCLRIADHQLFSIDRYLRWRQ